MREDSAEPSTPSPKVRPLIHPSLGMFGNGPIGSRPEPGPYLIASIPLLPPGEVPEGPARGVQDTATPAQSESEG